MPVNVIAPVVVAALGNGNDIVGVIDTVDDHVEHDANPIARRERPQVGCSAQLRAAE